MRGGRGPARPTARATGFRFGYLVHDVSRMRRTMMDQALGPLGITRSQWSVLSNLSRKGNDGMMQVELARLLELGKVSVGGLVDRLESTGLVERRADPADRRAKRVYIAERGWKMLDEMIAVASDYNKRIMEGISPEAQQIMEDSLAKVKENLRQILRDKNDRGKSDQPMGNDLPDQAAA